MYFNRKNLIFFVFAAMLTILMTALLIVTFFNNSQDQVQSYDIVIPNLDHASSTKDVVYIAKVDTTPDKFAVSKDIPDAPAKSNNTGNNFVLSSESSENLPRVGLHIVGDLYEIQLCLEDNSGYPVTDCTVFAHLFYGGKSTELLVDNLGSTEFALCFPKNLSSIDLDFYIIHNNNKFTPILYHHTFRRDHLNRKIIVNIDKVNSKQSSRIEGKISSGGLQGVSIKSVEMRNFHGSICKVKLDENGHFDLPLFYKGEYSLVFDVCAIDGFATKYRKAFDIYSDYKYILIDLPETMLTFYFYPKLSKQINIFNIRQVRRLSNYELFYEINDIGNREIADGIFNISCLPVGEYLISFLIEGYAWEHHSVVINQNRNISVDVNLDYPCDVVGYVIVNGESCNVEGMSLQVYISNSPYPIYSTGIGNGKFEIRSMKRGEYIIKSSRLRLNNNKLNISNPFQEIRIIAEPKEFFGK